MGRWVETAPPAPALDEAECDYLRSQLSRRLRLAVDRNDPLRARIVRACESTADLPPAERLVALQQFAREIRPQLDEDAARYAVPDWILAPA